MNAQEAIWNAIEHGRNARAIADLLMVGHYDAQLAGQVSPESMARAAAVLHREIAAALSAALDVQEVLSVA